jgi:hypothetical protein
MSPVSDVFRPCSTLIECSPAALPLIGGVLALVLAIIAIALWRGYRDRRAWVTAQVDDFTSVTLGRGPKVGMTLVRRGPYRRLVGIAPARDGQGDIRVRYRGGDQFEIRAAGAPLTTTAGRLAEITDAEGVTHGVVLRAFDQAPGDLRPADDEDGGGVSREATTNRRR